MPFQKAMSAHDGQTLSYHAVTEFAIDALTGGCSCVVGSWPDREAFMRYSHPVVRRVYDYAPATRDALESAYLFLRARPEWADAEVVA